MDQQAEVKMPKDRIIGEVSVGKIKAGTVVEKNI